MASEINQVIAPAFKPVEPDKRRLNWEPYLYLLPALVLVVAVLIYPLVFSAILSVHHWTIQTFHQGVPFVGLKNYADAVADARFWNALRVTGAFMVLALTLEFVLGLGLAVLLNRAVAARRITRTLVLMPMMCTNIVIGLIWRMMLNFDYGVFNFFMTSLGLQPVAWLSQPDTALLSLVIVDVWNTTCFVALILLAGMQAQPLEVREAAMIDGASTLQIFCYITLPLLRPALMVALLWRTIDTFRIFDVVFTLTAGGPAQATETISLYIYYNGFQQFNMGYTAALSMLMIAMLFAVAFLIYRLIGRVATLNE